MTEEAIVKIKSKWFIWLKRIVLVILAGVLLVVGFIAFTYYSANWASRGRLFHDVSKLPSAKVGLVFGTSDRYRGRENRYFRYRIDAAVEVWKAGKVETLIVSGDNRSEYYNEPEKMRTALIEAGVPKDRIVCDYAGLRTLDSVVRAKEIFGTTEIIFISQQFQNERAIYIAKANGMDAHAFNAKDVEFEVGLKTKLREVGARVKMWLDVNILDTAPTYLGEKEEMPE